MKKTILKVTVAFLALTLAGCGTTKDNSKSDSSNSVKTEKKQVKKTASTSNSQKKASKTASSQTSQAPARSNSQGSTTNNGQQQVPSTNEPRLVTLNGDLNRTLGHVLLPQKDGLGQDNSRLNIRFSGDSVNYVINYSVGGKTRPLNDPALQNETPYATLTKKTYRCAVPGAGDAGKARRPEIGRAHV